MVKTSSLVSGLRDWWENFLEEYNTPLTKDDELMNEGDLIFLRKAGHRLIMGFDSLSNYERGECVKSSKKGRKADIPTHVFIAHSLDVSGEVEEFIRRSLSEGRYSEAGECVSVVSRDLPRLALAVREEFNGIYKSKINSLSRKEHGQLKGIFREPLFYFGSVSFDGDEYIGAGVRSVIKRFPVGEHGGLSDKLYRDSRKFLVVPLTNSLLRFT